jgi:hypothetical protein
MSAKPLSLHLPPHLSDLQAQLTGSTSAQSKAMLNELELVGQVIAETRVLKADAPSLKKIEVLREGFTTTSGKACRCCGRPF